MGESFVAAAAQSQAGDAEAFRLLVEQHSHSIFRLAYRMTGNEHDAEDVVQETFLKAHRNLSRFEERANIKTWLYRIAVNCAHDLVRLRQRHQKGRQPEDPEGISPLDHVAADDPSPDRLLFSAQVQQKVSAAMARLSPIEKTAFVLRHFEGHGIEEIAPVLGLRTGATKNTIFRAVAKMRRELEPMLRPAK